MKTTLKYNTIETLQEQPAWKLFIDTIVDGCNHLFDSNLVSDVNATADNDSATVSIDELRLFDKYITEIYDSLTPSQKTMYADIYSRYNTTEVQYDDMQAKHAVLNYLNDIMHLNIKENISLRGLLRTLSLYDCKIKDIKMKDAVLPHTFKVQGYRKNSALYGFHTTNRTYDYETRGIKPENASGTYTSEYETGNVEADCTEYLIDENYFEEDTRYKYIYNLYGYNQKHPMISVSDIKEVRSFVEFEKTDSVSTHPNYIYIETTDVVLGDNDTYNVLTSTAFESPDNKDSGIMFFTNPNSGSIDNFLHNNNYSLSETSVDKWISITDEDSYMYESSFILNDNDSIDLIKENKRIKYNSEEYSLLQYKNVRFSLSKDSSVEILTFDKVIENDNPKILGLKTIEEIDSSYNEDIQKRYYIYKDSVYGREWIVLDNIKRYFNTPVTYLKSQLFSDECTLKAQPLFLYEHTDSGDDIKEVSLCANFINTRGGVGKISYEIEKYDIHNPTSTFVASNNVQESDPTANIVKAISYGDYFYKWEKYGFSQVNGKTFFYKDMYTAVNYDKAIANDPMNFFFDGAGDYQHVDDEALDFNNNNEKLFNNGSEELYNNTFKEEYIETMYFNHFVKVYPVLDEPTDNICSTTKLYCENLELVMFGNIVPFIVSYDRIGEQPEEGSEEILNDIDCSVFSKILSYNKHTHLITVNNPLCFENAYKPKYVVVAYQNASPFNNISSLDITSPNVYDYITETEDKGNKVYNNVDEDKTFSLKQVVKNMLEDYKSDKCELNLYAECEYEGDTLL